MEITQRIPLSQFAYVEFAKEYENEEEAIAHNAELIAIHEDAGLGVNEWAKVRRKMFSTGEFDPNIEGLSKAQRYFVNECKKALRDNEETIE